MTSMKIWGLEIEHEGLDAEAISYLSSLPDDLPSVAWVWAEMDRVWNELKLNNRRSIGSQPIGRFYRHPVWLMNGIFTASDPVSTKHRIAIAEHVTSMRLPRVADFGGGFGALAETIVQLHPEAVVSIVEPFPSSLALRRAATMPRIEFAFAAESATFDLAIAQDVLEHVEDPVQFAFEVAASVRPGGSVIFANCFYPVIKCHLPRTFHLRHTFALVMRAMGLVYEGTLKGADHAQLFRRKGTLDLGRAKLAERFALLVGRPTNILSKYAKASVRGLLSR